MIKSSQSAGWTGHSTGLEWTDDRKWTHATTMDDGQATERQLTQCVAAAEQRRGRSGLVSRSFDSLRQLHY